MLRIYFIMYEIFILVKWKLLFIINDADDHYRLVKQVLPSLISSSNEITSLENSRCKASDQEILGFEERWDHFLMSTLNRDDSTRLGPSYGQIVNAAKV